MKGSIIPISRKLFSAHHDKYVSFCWFFVQHRYAFAVLTCMKHYITYISAIICCLTSVSTIIAQDNQHILRESPSRDELSYTANTNRIKAVSEDGKPIYLNDINTKAVADFKRRFGNTDSERWLKRPESGYVAAFKKNRADYMVHYDKRGRWESTLKGYTEDLMPFEIRDIVKRNYYDYTITYVNEIETLNSNRIPTYLVYMQYKNLIKIMRIRDGEMDVWKEMKKQ